MIFECFVVPDNTFQGKIYWSKLWDCICICIQLRNKLIYWALSSWKCIYRASLDPVYWNCHLNSMVWYRLQRKVISRATNTEKRCILRNKLIPYLILLAYKGLGYEKVTTSLRSHLHGSHISGMKWCIHTSRVHQYLETLVPTEKTIFESK